MKPTLAHYYGKKTAHENPSKAVSSPSPVPEGGRKSALFGSTIRITFPEDRRIIKTIKRIFDVSYNSELDCWECSLSLDALEKLREAEFHIDPKILKWEADLFAPVVFDPDFDIPGLQHPDYVKEYQWEGVQWIEWWDGCCLLADDQGLGKTLQVLAWLQYRKDVRPALIICPAIAKISWYEEALFWMDNPCVQIVSGRQPQEIWGEIVIINYDILTVTKDGRDVLRSDLWGVNWKFIGLDEAHYVTNSETIRGWAVDQLVDRCPHVIPITATPSRHRPKDMFTLIHWVDRRVFPSWFKYAHRYCGPKKGYTGAWEYNGSSNEEELHELLSKTVMIRRKKQEVFKELPDKVRYVIPFEIENRDEYDKAEINFEEYLLNNPGGEVARNHIFAKMEKLKQLAVLGKLKASIEWLWDLLESEDKVVVFAEHDFTLNALKKEFGSLAVRVDGSVNDPKKRNEARIAFQRCKRCGVLKERHANSPEACKSWIADLSCRVFLSSRAGITNLTLTASNHVVFLELWNSPKDHDQGEDRVYGRAGDLHGATAWYHVAWGTIEMKLARTYDLKNVSLEKVMDGRELSEEMMLTQLMKSYQGGTK